MTSPDYKPIALAPVGPTSWHGSLQSYGYRREGEIGAPEALDCGTCESCLARIELRRRQQGAASCLPSALPTIGGRGVGTGVAMGGNDRGRAANCALRCNSRDVPKWQPLVGYYSTRKHWSP